MIAAVTVLAQWAAVISAIASVVYILKGNAGLATALAVLAIAFAVIGR